MWFIVIVTAGLSVWVTMWSTGTKGIDAFMVALVIILLGVMGRIIARQLPGASGRRS
jgi:hypothetical protein